jgi:uncharacterized protein (DUF1501 family)
MTLSRKSKKLHLPTDIVMNEQVTPIHTHDDDKSHLLLPDGSRHEGARGYNTAAETMEPVVEYNTECEELTRMRAFDRRTALKGMGIGAVLMAADWNRYSFTPAAAATPDSHIIVAVFLRGGLDGLGTVIPLGDANYQRMRPKLGLNDASVLPLPGTKFGLNPGLTQLHRLFKAGQLGIVNATGHPSTSRSHFVKQNFHESGATAASMRSGWLGRYLASSPKDDTFRALTLGSTAAFMMAHESPTLAMSRLGDFSISAPSAKVREQVVSNVKSLWGPAGGPGGAAVEFTIDASLKAAEVSAGASSVQYPAGNPYAGRFQELAKLIKADVGLETACVDVEGWDMHTDMGTGTGGELYTRLSHLDKALGTFWDDLGATLQKRVTVVTMSEFGRTGSTNGGNGTDHGFGNVMFVLGGKGGVHGSWPGLQASSLVQGDLAVTNDYRDVVAELMTQRMKVTASQLKQILPDYTPKPLGAF